MCSKLKGLCNYSKGRIFTFYLLHFSSDPSTWNDIFMTHNCQPDNKIPDSIQQLKFPEGGSAHNSIPYHSVGTSWLFLWIGHNPCGKRWNNGRHSTSGFGNGMSFHQKPNITGWLLETNDKMTTAILSMYTGVDQQFMELDVLPRQENYQKLPFSLPMVATIREFIANRILSLLNSSKKSHHAGYLQ